MKICSNCLTIKFLQSNGFVASKKKFISFFSKKLSFEPIFLNFATKNV
jgi:hypothetical protein